MTNKHILDNLSVMKTESVSDFYHVHTENKVMHPALHIFDFYTNANCKIGTLVCHKSKLNIRPNYDSSVLAIDFLEVTDKDKGYGTTIVKFAKEYSEQIGCKGYMTLKADGTYMPEKIPHIFYRKLGFSTLDKKIDKQLDKILKQKGKAKKHDFPTLLMHYPADKSKQVKLKNIIINGIKRFFKL